MRETQSQGTRAATAGQPAESSTEAFHSGSILCLHFPCALESERRMLGTCCASFGHITLRREFTPTVSPPLLLSFGDFLGKKPNFWSSWQPRMYSLHLPVSNSPRLHGATWNHSISEKLFLAISILWTKVKVIKLTSELLIDVGWYCDLWKTQVLWKTHISSILNEPLTVKCQIGSDLKELILE